MHYNLQKHMVPEIYVYFYCVMINKYEVQNKTVLDISISKLNFGNFFP
jgi:hypothetical protein